MSTQIKNAKIAGVILAGGRARRMANQDKGLIQFKNRALISYALEAMSSVCQLTFINANRNLIDYKAFGYPVITDQTHNFDGPLAGILTTLIHTDAELLLVMPCDTPFLRQNIYNDY